MLWLAAHHKDKNALGILSREIAPAGTGMGKSSNWFGKTVTGLDKQTF